ncbi:uncharacterized protein LOC119088092 isoform X1 [Peromyscus leucopus]|uniref:uncharacterized protein LOC119088092 isoform X1 n=1 Tax=Peromyscus leucopus TaxID=10041 RepID=UPI001885502C|nr:uncharacterized protein LOC119088092 isoform X1 [Peromyscus leucopus]
MGLGLYQLCGAPPLCPRLRGAFLARSVPDRRDACCRGWGAWHVCVCVCLRERVCVCVFKIQKKEAWLSSAAEAGRALSVPTPSERAPWGHRRYRKTAEVRDGHGERWTLAISSAGGGGGGGCVRPNPMNKTHSRSLAAHVRRQKTVGSAAAAEDSLGAGGCRQGQHGPGARTFRAGPRRSRQRTVTYDIDDLRFLQLLSCFLTFLKLALEADVYTLEIKFPEEPVFVHKGPWHLLACLSLAF